MLGTFLGPPNGPRCDFVATFAESRTTPTRKQHRRTGGLRFRILQSRQNPPKEKFEFGYGARGRGAIAESTWPALEGHMVPLAPTTPKPRHIGSGTGAADDRSPCCQATSLASAIYRSLRHPCTFQSEMQSSEMTLQSRFEHTFFAMKNTRFGKVKKLEKENRFGSTSSVVQPPTFWDGCPAILRSDHQNLRRAVPR